MEDVVLSSQFTLTCGGSILPAAALNFSVSLSTGRRATLFGTGGFDFGVSLLLAKQLGDFYVYLNGGYVWLGSRNFVGIPLKSNRWTVFSGVEYRRWSKTSLIFQNTINSRIARDDVELFEFRDELNLEVQHALSSRLVLGVALIENLFPVKNSPDFGVHIGLNYDNIHNWLARMIPIYGLEQKGRTKKVSLRDRIGRSGPGRALFAGAHLDSRFE